MSKHTLTPVRRADAREWERVVFAEVLIPGTPNVFGDYWTPEGIKEAAYLFATTGYGIDVEHDNLDVSGQVTVVENFLVRPGDPDFILDSWVVGMRIDDDVLWQKVLDNELNGFSFEATLAFLEAVYVDSDDGTRTGFTEPSLEDGHRHAYAVLVDADNRPISGGTDEVNGHSHKISTHTVTDSADGHSHRFNLVKGKEST